jgi:hypothetical protein
VENKTVEAITIQGKKNTIEAKEKNKKNENED